MTRVFHLIKSLGRGGAEMLLSEGLRYADRSRFEYGFGYFLPWKDDLVSSLKELDAEVICFSKSTNARILLSAGRVARFLSEWEADILHCHLPIAGVVGRIAGRMARVPVVYTEHNNMERYHAITRYANLLTWSLQAEVVAVSGEVECSIRRHVKSSPPVHVVLNGIDTAHFTREEHRSQELRIELGIPDGVPVVGTVAVFRHQKRLDLWIEAASLIHQKHPHVHFLLVGNGPMWNELHALTTSVGLSKHVHFSGLREDVIPLLALIDIFLSSSDFEGLPLALLEAMAMRCAVVATAVGGVPEVIEHGVNGFLVRSGDPLGWAEEVSKMLLEQRAQSGITQRGRQTVEARFGISRMVRNLEDIYRGIVQDETLNIRQHS